MPKADLERQLDAWGRREVATAHDDLMSMTSGAFMRQAAAAATRRMWIQRGAIIGAGLIVIALVIWRLTAVMTPNATPEPESPVLTDPSGQAAPATAETQSLDDIELREWDLSWTNKDNEN